MKKAFILIYILFLFFSFTTIQAQGKDEETTDITSKKFDFDIDKVVLFLNFIDSDLKTPITANVQIINEEGKTIVNETGFSIRAVLPVNQTYTFKTSQGKYKDSTYTVVVNKKQFDKYEHSQSVSMYPVKVPITVTLGSPDNKDINPETIRVSVRNQGILEAVTFRRKGNSNEYVADLRDGDTYDLEVKDPTKNFFYTQTITASSSNGNINIPDSKFDRLKPVEPTVVVNNENNFPPNYDPRNPNPNLNLNNNGENADDNGNVEENTEKPEPEIKEVIKEVPEIEPIDKKAETYEDVMELTEEQIAKDEKELIEKQRKMGQKLDELKGFMESEELSTAQKDTLKNYIQRLEERMQHYDQLYQKLREQNFSKISDIKLQLGVRESFWKRFWWIIVIFGVILGIMFVIMVIFYFIARNRRKQRDQLQTLYDQIDEEKKKSDDLLLNILPLSVANELKTNGFAKMRSYSRVSILFTDFKGFTDVASKMAPDKLMEELNDCFTAFDRIIAGHNMEKIKTIGDAYMCAGGIPDANKINPLDAVLAGLEMQAFMVRRRQEKLEIGDDYWRCRLGINTGEVRAGVIGTSKFAYDIWGDPVNIASRMESGGEVNKVNISDNTYELIKDFFDCTYRGEVEVKNGLVLKMYFVDRIKPELSADKNGLNPNEKFETLKAEQFETQVNKIESKS